MWPTVAWIVAAVVIAAAAADCKLVVSVHLVIVGRSDHWWQLLRRL